MARTRRTRMSTAAKLAPAVVVAGTVLGWLLGAAANPVMKPLVEPGQRAIPQAGLAPPVASNRGWPGLAPEASHTADAYPRDLDYADLGYADLDYSDLDYGAGAGSDWALPDTHAESELVVPSPLVDALEAADEAGHAAEDAEKAMASPAQRESGMDAGTRKSGLAQSGLY